MTKSEELKKDLSYNLNWWSKYYASTDNQFNMENKQFKSESEINFNTSAIDTSMQGKKSNQYL
jgi:hypothetical protein